MKKHVFLTIAACGGMLLSANKANAQETVVMEESITVTDAQCKTHYYNTWRDGWFIQAGAGINTSFFEGYKNADKKDNITATYNVGVGRWFSPYMGFRFSGYYGAVHYADDNQVNRFRSANLNVDLMWDMFNSLGGVNSKRVFSIVPFVGIGGTYNWKYRENDENIMRSSGGTKTNTWALPVSAGIQLRFRAGKYVDLFAEGRAAFYGDNFNNVAFGRPVDINTQVTGGISIKFGGRDFQTYEPCSYLGYINNLNNQVNALRGELAATATALAAAEAQLPCPEVPTVVECAEVNAPMLSTVRFAINSAKVTSMEMVNVYNVAEYMKANPNVNVVITGFADKDTGSAAYNQSLSERRAQAVYD
ncbi:MAG: OmpA family protein, partial [Muribaculaceae bacterium]|nr:OmpA family protein [Muribaculaceae bacterium]